MRPAVSRSSSARHVPAGDAPQHLGGFGVEILEHAAQELADDQRVHQRGLVFGVDGMANGIERHVPAIDLVREIDLVGAAAIVVGAARADGETQRHRLQRPRLVAGNLESLDLRREGDAVVPDRLQPRGGCPRRADRRALARANQIDRAQQRIAASEREPRLVEPSALDALHRKRDRAAGADRVEAELVAALGGAQHGVGIAHAAQRAQREQALVLDADAGAACQASRCARSRWCSPRSSRAFWSASRSAARARGWQLRRRSRSESCASAARRSD